ncbi:MAG: hypothetical protein GX142_09260 [Chloroflexi bacterium]|nr:hypothetical protein [Chloroflexota bacterium]
MNTDQNIQDLVEQLQRLELHAAHSGRVILNTLIDFVEKSQVDNLSQLADSVQAVCLELMAALPPYGPPLNIINQVMVVLENGLAESESVKAVENRLASFGKQAPLLNIHKQIAEHLIPVLPKPVRIYTHTLSETLLGVLLELHKREYIQSVYVTESRPNNDGWVTAQKLAEIGVKTYLTIDIGFPALLDKVDVMLSGAEIISLDGSVVGKVGVYPAATFCKTHSVPVYIIADTNKILPFSTHSLNMTPYSFNDLGLNENVQGIEIFGSFFDTTPAKYITGYITERGQFNLDLIEEFVKTQRVSRWLKTQLNVIDD